MKKITTLLIAIGAVMALATASIAQGPGPGGPPGGPGGPGGGGRRGGGMMRMNEEVLSKMNLTASQKAKLKVLQKSFQADMKAFRDKMGLKPGTRPSPDQRQAMMSGMMKMGKDFHDSLAKILKPDQMKAFDKAIADARAKMFQGGGGWGRGPGGPGGPGGRPGGFGGGGGK